MKLLFTLLTMTIFLFQTFSQTSNEIMFEAYPDEPAITELTIDLSPTV